MNLDQAKAKLADLSRSTGIKHPKVLVSELCVIISFLLDEINKIKTSPITSKPSVQPPWPDRPKREFQLPTPDKLPPKKRSGNAGDAE